MGSNGGQRGAVSITRERMQLGIIINGIPGPAAESAPAGPRCPLMKKMRSHQRRAGRPPATETGLNGQAFDL